MPSLHHLTTRTAYIAQQGAEVYRSAFNLVLYNSFETDVVLRAPGEDGQDSMESFAMDLKTAISICFKVC